jgi:hypothetical protein
MPGKPKPQKQAQTPQEMLQVLKNWQALYEAKVK